MKKGNKGKYKAQTKTILAYERKDDLHNISIGFAIGVATVLVGLVAGLILISLM
jgi:hypothetical protein